MLQLETVPFINIDLLQQAYNNLPFKDKLKYAFVPSFSKSLERSLKDFYNDVVVIDPDDTLKINTTYPDIEFEYVSNSRRTGVDVTTHTIYRMQNVVPYALLGDAKVCYVEFFEIALDKSWNKY